MVTSAAAAAAAEPHKAQALLPTATATSAVAVFQPALALDPTAMATATVAGAAEPRLDHPLDPAAATVSDHLHPHPMTASAKEAPFHLRAANQDSRGRTAAVAAAVGRPTSQIKRPDNPIFG